MVLKWQRSGRKKMKICRKTSCVEICTYVLLKIHLRGLHFLQTCSDNVLKELEGYTDPFIPTWKLETALSYSWIPSIQIGNECLPWRAFGKYFGVGFISAWSESSLETKDQSKIRIERFWNWSGLPDGLFSSQKNPKLGLIWEGLWVVCVGIFYDHFE
jgi:hypothetical protein